MLHAKPIEFWLCEYSGTRVWLRVGKTYAMRVNGLAKKTSEDNDHTVMQVIRLPIRRWQCCRLCSAIWCILLVGAAMSSRICASQKADLRAAARQHYSAKITATYNFRFGKTLPFLPSNMTTDTGEFINPNRFPTAQYCGHCHREAHQQWRQSAHSNANRVPYYLKNVDLLNQEKGVEFSRHCEGCHNPIALVAGALTQGAPKKHSYDQDGVTCSVCHSIQKVDTRGTGSYVLGVPAVLTDEAGIPISRPVTDAEILAHPDRHSKAVMKEFYRTSEFCSSCHKAALPKTLNDYKWLRAISLYDEWQNSSFAKQSPLPFYTKGSVSTCQACHMERETLKDADLGAKEGQLASHRWIGANTVIPKIYGFDEQAARVAEFLRRAFNVDIFGLERGDGTKESDIPRLIAPLGLTGFRVGPSEVLTADIVIQNKGIGHSHVPEQRDMYESWVDFTVKDSRGNVLSQSGFIKPGGDLDEQAHSFTNRLVNPKGELNDLHQVWNNRVVPYNNTIQSGRSQLVRYAFRMPKITAGQISLTATVKYRRFNQHFIDFGMGKHYEMPIIEMASQTRTIYVGENPAATPESFENKEWMRWNNFGIALLDAQQYAGSIQAFEKVAELRPEYADVFTNIGLVKIRWEKYSEARPSLEKALAIDPGNARAQYYRAEAERNEGNLDAAIRDLEAVAESFPKSRDVHRELGFCYYEQRKYDLARIEYEKLQNIDPDDLSAHYHLAILYRQFGLNDKATREAAYFADQKDDPSASMDALQYLRNHGGVARESVVWHVHELVEREPALTPGSAQPTNMAAH